MLKEKRLVLGKSKIGICGYINFEQISAGFEIETHSEQRDENLLFTYFFHN